MKLSELVEQAREGRVWLVLDEDQLQKCGLRAAQFYAGYGDIRSVSGSDKLQGATDDASIPPPLDPEPDVVPALPIKDITLISGCTDLTTGEWAIISPLFLLYAERENALFLEATRGLGADVYGRSVAEIAQEIMVMETETIPQKAFMRAVITV